MDHLLSLLLMGPALALGLWAQGRVQIAFQRWNQVPATAGISGGVAARRILREAGLQDVGVQRLHFGVGDHYDPRRRQVCLSKEVFDRASVTSLAVAAHECGHAIQHARGYRPLLWREAAVPIIRLSSGLLPLSLMLGVGFRLSGLMLVGVACHGLLALFQLLTLPVEFDASRRARLLLKDMKLILPGQEEAGVRNVLHAAALTYVASLAHGVAQLLHLVLWQRRRSV